MKDQRQVGQHVHHLRKRGRGIDYFSLVVRTKNQRARVKKTVAQHRTVTHQMTNGDRPNSRLGLLWVTGHAAWRHWNRQLIDHATNELFWLWLCLSRSKRWASV